ncbi:ATP-binding protein [Geomonas nitrogeniifigens]|uniref:ATP-binding protein n=1 Tax=Geomonas diazotrophica TaxID=2843197 RepID=UPI001C2C5ACB|nr:ATP-binding protein [Geomonas nitrogeniifigens]QXE85526.1 ATP-binding protein [Geomonas nitrogeniifigens]
MSHTLQEVGEIHDIAKAGGGRVAVISGGEKPFYAGLARTPTETLLEAVLTFLAAGTCYEHILVCTGQQCGGHLPEWEIGNTTVGNREAIWLFRGSIEDKTSRDYGDFGDLDAVMANVVSDGPVTRGIYICQHQQWPVRIEEFLKEVEVRAGVNWMSGPQKYKEAKDPHATRTAVVVDFSYLFPQISEERYPSDRHFADARRGIEKRFKDLPGTCKGGKMDLFLLCDDKVMVQNLGKGNILAGVDVSFPKLGWNLNNCTVLGWPGFDRKNVMGRYLGKAAGAQNLYEAFKNIPVRAKVSAHRGIAPEDYIAPERIWNHVKEVQSRINDKDEMIHSRIRQSMKAGRSEDEAIVIAQKEYEKKFSLNYSLLYGPPGTGKTTLVNVIANLLGPHVKVYPVTASDIGTEGLVGKGVQKLNDMYQKWKAEELCIVYFNEADGLLVPNQYNEDIILTMKQMLSPPDGSVHTNIVFVADTNNSEHIDPAIRSRFKRKFYIGLPSPSARQAMIRKQIESCRYIGTDVLLEDVTIEIISELLNGRSGRDIDTLFTILKEQDDTQIILTRKSVVDYVNSNIVDSATLEAVQKYQKDQLTFERECEAYYQQRP